MSIPSFFSKPVPRPRMRVSSLLGRNASCCDFKQLFPRLAIVALHGETAEVISADDAVFNQSVAGFGNLLFFLFGLGELARVADSHGTSESVGEFDLGVRAILLMLPNRSYQTATCRELWCLSIVAESCGGFCTFIQTNPVFTLLECTLFVLPKAQICRFEPLTPRSVNDSRLNIQAIAIRALPPCSM